jgi:methionine aminotransferase
LCNANPVRVALNDDYTPNWEIIEKHVLQTKMIIINNPHNPTGKILSESDFEAWKCYEKYPEIVLLSDEVYEYITFEEKHISAHTRKNY